MAVTPTLLSICRRVEKLGGPESPLPYFLQYEEDLPTIVIATVYIPEQVTYPPDTHAALLRDHAAGPGQKVRTWLWNTYRLDLMFGQDGWEVWQYKKHDDGTFDIPRMGDETGEPAIPASLAAALDLVEEVEG